MAWKVESRTESGRWVAHDGAQWTADVVTRPLVIALAGGAQPLTPTGPYYTPKSPDDEVAVYLTAMSVVPAPQVSGDPPRVPRPPAGDEPDDVVY